MLNNPYLDTIISLTLVFALLSVLVSLIVEAWNNKTKERGVFLQKLIYRLLNDPLNYNYGYHIYQHPIINRMRKDGNSFPYYISAESFCNALIDTVADLGLKVAYVPDATGTYKMMRDGSTMPLADRFVAGVKGMNESDMKRLFMNFIDRNKSADVLDFDKLKAEMGKWYNDFMDRATGEYKNNQRGKLQIIGFLVAVALNVDTVHMTRVFLLDKTLRDSMVQHAESAVDHRDPKDTTDYAFLRAVSVDTTVPMPTRMKAHAQCIRLDTADIRRAADADKVFTLIQQWRLPIGWGRDEAPVSWGHHRAKPKKPHCTRRACCGRGEPDTKEAVPQKPKLPPEESALYNYIQHRNTPMFSTVFLWFIGVFISGYALSFGAPFWFEVLVKLINIRRAGVKPERKDA